MYVIFFACGYLKFLKIQSKKFIHWTHAMCIGLSILCDICYSFNSSVDKTIYNELAYTCSYGFLNNYYLVPWEKFSLTFPCFLVSWSNN